MLNFAYFIPQGVMSEETREAVHRIRIRRFPDRSTARTDIASMTSDSLGRCVLVRTKQGKLYASDVRSETVRIIHNESGRWFANQLAMVALVGGIPKEAAVEIAEWRKSEAARQVRQDDAEVLRDAFDVLEQAGFRLSKRQHAKLSGIEKICAPPA